MNKDQIMEMQCEIFKMKEKLRQDLHSWILEQNFSDRQEAISSFPEMKYEINHVCDDTFVLYWDAESLINEAKLLGRRGLSDNQITLYFVKTWGMETRLARQLGIEKDIH